MKIETNGVSWLALYPKDKAGLVMLRRDRERIERAEGLNCAVFLNKATAYICDKMLEEGIPFIIKDKQVYLPFIGYLINKANQRKLTPVHLISFLTQKMLLMAIYERWKDVRVSEAAKRLGVSRKSAGRCFDEMEYLEIQGLETKGRTRV